MKKSITLELFLNALLDLLDGTAPNSKVVIIVHSLIVSEHRWHPLELSLHVYEKYWSLKIKWVVVNMQLARLHSIGRCYVGCWDKESNSLAQLWTQWMAMTSVARCPLGVMWHKCDVGNQSLSAWVSDPLYKRKHMSGSVNVAKNTWLMNLQAPTSKCK